jgi:hypothetical protein
MDLCYVSNLPQTAQGGGYSLRNAAAWEVLHSQFGARYVGPVSPPALSIRQKISGLQRRLGMRGTFTFFHPDRLRRIADEVAQAGALSGQAVFFNGFTPWIATQPTGPYVAWNDCGFHDYIRIHHSRDAFQTRDIERIEQQEADWLSRAKMVILRSAHFAKRTCDYYGLDPARVVSLPNFSTMVPPETDSFAGGQGFVFMSTTFEGKNGPTVVEAFAKVRQRHPQAQLSIIGDLPTQRPDQPGVNWLGYLSPADPEQNALKRQILAEARCMVHPTEFDTNPAVLVEAAYFGCPVISSRAFAIPEVVQDGVTGWLTETPRDPDVLAEHMTWMLEAGPAYDAMRRAARDHAMSRLTLDQFKAELATATAQAIPGLSRKPIS